MVSVLAFDADLTAPGLRFKLSVSAGCHPRLSALTLRFPLFSKSLEIEFRRASIRGVRTSMFIGLVGVVELVGVSLMAKYVGATRSFDNLQSVVRVDTQQLTISHGSNGAQPLSGKFSFISLTNREFSVAGSEGSPRAKPRKTSMTSMKP